ncbi:MAG: MiaB/RimO family radical SAM methylthiotransferase [Deltaproteobacteria bacterium]|nr:MiaB/RimO family radical SAM methylthiotransferase [Deltaproteobacteria bacterium]
MNLPSSPPPSGALSPDAERPRAAIHALGCRLNLAEADAIAQSLRAQGYRMVPWGQEAEVFVLNSCTVTGPSGAKTRQALSAIRRRWPQARLAVVGCHAQVESAELAGLADLVIGTEEKMNVAAHLANLPPHSPPKIIRPAVRRGPFQQSFGALGGHTRHHLKVQDGCDFMCSFCVIPLARGRARPRLLDNLLEEARQAAQAGARELVVTGVNVGTWEENGKNFLDLIDALNAIDGPERIRVGSIEFTTVGEGLLSRMADPAHKLVPFLHLPLQSGSETVLAEMNRRYTPQAYHRFAQSALARVNDLCLGADVMTGFPGETEERFLETLAFLESLPFAYLHVFPYSPRKGTPAARREDQVPPALRQARAARLRALDEQKRLAYQRRFLGRVLPVLLESSSNPGRVGGYTPHYVRVEVNLSEENPLGLANPLANTIVPLRLMSTGLPAMAGARVEEANKPESQVQT